jgi:RHS repeat-associated protein
VVKTASYDAFGNMTLSGSGDLGRYGYTGREIDVETGLQYNRARYYDPISHRWLSQDPLGFDAGDSNLYRYVNNAPTNGTDPSGMQTNGLGGQGGLGSGGSRQPGAGGYGGLGGPGGMGGPGTMSPRPNDWHGPYGPSALDETVDAIGKGIVKVLGTILDIAIGLSPFGLTGCSSSPKSPNRSNGRPLNAAEQKTLDEVRAKASEAIDNAIWELTENSAKTNAELKTIAPLKVPAGNPQFYIDQLKKIKALFDDTTFLVPLDPAATKSEIDGKPLYAYVLGTKNTIYICPLFLETAELKTKVSKLLHEYGRVVGIDSLGLSEPTNKIPADPDDEKNIGTWDYLISWLDNKHRRKDDD